MVGIVLGVLDDYLVRNNLGYFVMGNADTNDTMLEAIAKDLQDVHGIQYDPVEHRLRCIGHVINLSVQAFLFGQHPDLEEDQKAFSDPNEEELRQYRRLGSQGKLHNINTYILRTPQRKQRFRLLSNGLMPVRDHKIKWNSWYLMVNWSLTKIKTPL